MALASSSSVSAATTVGGCRGERLALGVVGRRAPAEPDGREVLLVEPDEVVQQARRAVRAEEQEARGHRVERAGVADLAGADEAAHPRDDVVAGESLRLVDEEDAAVHAVKATVARDGRPRRRAYAGAVRIGIIGAGALGGTFAVLLARAGHDVEVTARGASLAAIRAGGIRL